MSPYEERYIDVKFIGELPGSFVISVLEDPQTWRLLCLAMGIGLLFHASILSSRAPPYFSISKAVGAFLLFIIITYQGMLPLNGRENFFYNSIYVSVLGAVVYVPHRISMLIVSVLVNFGLSEELRSLAYRSVLLGIVSLGYWIVRPYVTFDLSVVQFVKWAMRFMATAYIFQSTLDAPLAMIALVASAFICFQITKRLDQTDNGVYTVAGGPWLKFERIRGWDYHQLVLQGN